MGKNSGRGFEVPVGKSVVLFDDQGNEKLPNLSGNRTQRRRAQRDHDKEVQGFLRKQEEDQKKIRND